jgi:hypothetical protein
MKTIDEEIAPETLAAIVAAASVFLGKSVAIRSLNQISESGKNLSRWTRQSRMATLAAHNLTHPRPTRGGR